MQIVITLGLESNFHFEQIIWIYIEGLVLSDDRQYFFSFQKWFLLNIK